MRLLLLTMLVCFAACQSAEPPPPAVPSPDAAVAPAPPPDTGWALGPDGIGPARIGMTPGELRAAGLSVDEDTLNFGTECYYARIAEAPDSVFFMIEEGTLARVDVRSRRVATASGDRVGDAEAAILARYPNALVQPHHYTDGHYLVVPAADTTRALLFETDGQHVTEYRAGRQPAVAYVEGCS